MRSPLFIPLLLLVISMTPYRGAALASFPLTTNRLGQNGQDGEHGHQGVGGDGGRGL